MKTPTTSWRAILCAGLLATIPAVSNAQVAEKIASIDTTWGESHTLAPARGFEPFADFSGDRSFHSEIAFYESVLSYGPINDPRPVLLLANAYIVTNQQDIGIEFFEEIIERFRDDMSSETEAVYISAYALLRATYAEKIGLLSRIGWVKDTFEILERANEITQGEHPLVHWSAGIIYTQVPGFFGKRKEARRHLEWLVAHPELEPTPGFFREAYRHLAILSRKAGDREEANTYMALSGYSDSAPETLFMGWFATSNEAGLRFTPKPVLEEIIPGRVFALRGFGFSELHFIVSKDGNEMISIDAGTQPYSLKAGLEYLREQKPGLPPLKTVFLTHAHWDHIGGHTFLRGLDRDITFYGRENFHGTVERADRKHVFKQFRGEDFQSNWITGYVPDIPISAEQTVIIDGSTFELVPATGGETEDALLIFAPELGLAFAGDTMMPFYGEPWVEEGFVHEALQTMDAILARHPERILHGHYGLTEIYGHPTQVASFRRAYGWLIDETEKFLVNGYSIEEIRRFNLIPPGLQNEPEGFFGYVAARDHIIARLGDHMTGIWRENQAGDDPLGLSTLTLTEYGRMFDLYLRLSEREIEGGIRRMIEGGDNELALKMASAALRRHPDNDDILALRNEAGDRLRSATQYFDPFRFVTYTEITGQEHSPLPSIIDGPAQ